MKKFLLSVLLLCAGALVHAAGTWMLVTDSGKQIPVAQVGMLVGADDQPVFTVLQRMAVPRLSTVSPPYHSCMMPAPQALPLLLRNRRSRA